MKKINFAALACIIFFCFLILLSSCVSRKKTSEEENIASAQSYLKKFDMEFVILGPTGRTGEDLIFEYYAAPVSNQDIVLKVMSLYAVDNIFPFFPSIFKSKMYSDTFRDAIIKYAVGESTGGQPIVFNRFDDIDAVAETILIAMGNINENLVKYGFNETRMAGIIITVLGEETEFSILAPEKDIIKQHLQMKYFEIQSKQEAINNGDPVYDYEYEYAHLAIVDTKAEKTDENTIRITLDCSDDRVYFTGYKEYRKSGEFAYLYIKITNEKQEAMKDYTYYYDVSDINSVSLCDGNGNTELVWSRSESP